jgi:peptide/nickel transport system permease protein
MGLFIDGGITDWASLLEFLKRLIIPITVISLNEACGLIRRIRAQMLDEQEKPYVLCIRAKGTSERTITFKYQMRAILNPIVSGLGGMIAGVFNGSTITAIVLMLPTQGPILLKALQTQDVYLSGGILLISATLVVIGTLISDLLLAALDPRIKLLEEIK